MTIVSWCFLLALIFCLGVFIGLKFGKPKKIGTLSWNGTALQLNFSVPPVNLVGLNGKDAIISIDIPTNDEEEFAEETGTM